MPRGLSPSRHKGKRKDNMRIKAELGKLLPIKTLYQKYSGIVTSKLVVRDFKRWCEAHGLRPYDYYLRGFGLNGYYAPPEFFEWWERVLLPRYRYWSKMTVEEVKE